MPYSVASKPDALAVIIDEESSIRQFVSLVLQSGGIDTIEFVDGASFREHPPSRQPDLVFLNINLDSQDAIQSIEALAAANFAGAVQLMSNRGSAVLDSVRQAGEHVKVRMLPSLKKPFETAAIQKIIADLRLGPIAAEDAIRVSLSEALQNGSVEFWYQPKVDLRRKQLAGAEAFARVRHATHGVLQPGSFMPGASDADVRSLAELALVSALQAGLNLAKVGVDLRISVNMPLDCLKALDVGKTVRDHRGTSKDWPGLIIDVPEAQIIADLPGVLDLAQQLAEHQVRLAVDDFGRGYGSLARLKALPFAEMKLDRSFVAGCGSDKANVPLCKTVIDLAHSFGSLAVGIGLEKAPDAMALVSMGCDLGQGFLYGEPLPQDRFTALLKQRVMVKPAAQVA